MGNFLKGFQNFSLSCYNVLILSEIGKCLKFDFAFNRNYDFNIGFQQLLTVKRLRVDVYPVKSIFNLLFLLKNIDCIFSRLCPLRFLKRNLESK